MLIGDIANTSNKLTIRAHLRACRKLPSQFTMDDFDEDAFNKFFPSSFGKQAKTIDVDTQIDRSKRVEVSAPKTDEKELSTSAAAAQPEAGDDEKKNSDSDSDDDSDDSDDDEDEFPVSHELVLKSHERAVTTMTVDPSGARLITGSSDCNLKLHDFASMTPSTLRSFKTVDPSARQTSASQDTHPVNFVAFNPIAPR
ncbi:unnamed protein product [Penicillium salamii]|nr:unnamed protein product [Penicillium salamii]